jgi:hypothetical protein
MTTSSLQDYEVVGLAAAKSTCLNSPTSPRSCRSPKVLSAPRLPTTSAHSAFGFRQKVWQGGGPPALLPRCKRTLPGHFSRFLAALRLDSSTAKGSAGGIAHAAVACRGHDPEKPNDQPGRAAVHQVRPRTHEAPGPPRAAARSTIERICTARFDRDGCAPERVRV